MADVTSLTNAYQSLEMRKQASALALLDMQEKVFKKVPEIQEIGFKITSLGAAYTMAKLSKDFAQAQQLRQQMEELDKKRKQLLVANGFTPDALEEKHACPICKDKGFVDGKMCSCMQKSMAKYRQKTLTALSPAPDVCFEDFSLEYYSKQKNDRGIIPYNHMKSVLEYCQNYSRYFTRANKSVLMLGNAGLGKTHLACSIAKECMNKGLIVMYASSQSLFSQIEQMKYNAEDMIGNITECDLFVLDDLGTEYLTNYGLSVLYNIINTRLIHGLPCIYTTNLSSQQSLITRYGEKIASRIIGSCDLLAFFGEDIRIKSNLK